MSNIPLLRRRPQFSIKRVGAALLVLAGSVALAGCDQTHRYGLPAPATEQAKSVVDLWLFCLYIAVALGALLFLVMIYSIIRHRRKNNELPVQTEGHVGFEIGWTVIPFIIVAILFGYGLQAQATATDLRPNPAVTVDVTGYQWNWRFGYPKEGVAVAGGPQLIQDENTFPEMVLPVNQRIRLNLIAADVNHAFFVPNFLTKRDLIPGVRNVIEVTPDKVGTYVGHCAEFCGLNHSQMNFRVRVVSQSEYTAWIAQQKLLQNGSNTNS